MKERLITKAMPQYLRWFPQLKVRFYDITRSNYERLFRDALMKGSENRDFDYYLTTPVDCDALLNGAVQLIQTEDKSYLLESAMLICGFLNHSEAIPHIVDAIKQDRCDSSDMVVALKALFMLEYRDMANLLEQVEEKMESEDFFKLAKILVATPENDKLPQILEDLEELSDEELQHQALTHLIELQQKGVDTSGMAEKYLESSHYDYYHNLKAKWILSVGTKEIIKQALEDSYDDLALEILLQCIADPQGHVFVEPVVSELLQDWLDDSNFKKTVAAICLKSLWTGKVQSDLLSHDDWVVRAGAAIGGFAGIDPENLTERLQKEDDSDVTKLLQISRLMKAKGDPVVQQAVLGLLLSLRENYYSIFLTALSTLSIHHEAILPEACHIVRPFYEEIPQTREMDSHLLMRLIPENFTSPLEGHPSSIAYRDYCYFIMMIQNESPMIDDFLEFKFLSEKDFDKARSLLLGRYYRRGSFSSDQARAKLAAHLSDEDEAVFSEGECRELESLLFTQCDSTYKSRILGGMASSLRNDIGLCYRLVTMGELTESQLQTVYQAMDGQRGHEEAQALSSLLSSTLDSSLIQKAAPMLYAGGIEDFQLSGILAAINCGDVSPEASLPVLSMFADISDENELRHTLKQLVSMASAEGATMLLENLKNHPSWSKRQSLCKFIAAYPQESYLDMILELLGDDDTDVQEAAEKGATAVLRKQGLQDITNAAVVKAGDDAFQDMETLLEGKVKDEAMVAEYHGKTFMLLPLEPGFAPDAQGNYLESSIWRNIVLHGAVTFVDKKTGSAVVEIKEEQTGDVIKWMLENKKSFFYTVKEA